MPTPKEYIGVKGDECDCGRRKTILHCPVCGSSRVYARKRRLHKMLDGSEKYVEIQYCCQRCGHLFIEEEREWCNAPPVGPTLALQKAKALYEARQSGEYLRPSEAKAAKAIEELLKTQSLVEARAKTPVDVEKAKKDFEYALRYQWADLNIEAKLKGTPLDEDVEAFVARNMKERGIDYSPEQSYYGAFSQRSHETEPVQEQQHKLTAREVFEIDAQDEREKMSAAEQSIRIEWAKAKLNGRAPTTTVDEYVKRRLAGELFS